MIPSVRGDIISILHRLLTILQTKEFKDVLEVKKLSDNIIHQATLEQDQDAVSTAVVVYALSKMMEHTGNMVDYREFRPHVEQALGAIRRNKITEFRESIKQIYAVVAKKEAKMSRYVGEVLDHARMKKGCKFCEHGLSSAQSARLLNISQWELMQYLGKTRFPDQNGKLNDVRSRLRFARGLFR